MNTPRELPQSVVDFLAERRNPSKPKIYGKPWTPPTDNELRARYGKRHDDPSTSAQDEADDKAIDF